MRTLRRATVAAALLSAAPLAAVLVSGTARTSGGAGLSGMTVQVWSLDGTLASQTVSAASGYWSVSLGAGTYRFLAFDPNGVYATDFYSAQPTYDAGTKMTVTECGALTGIDFALPVAGFVTGTVRETGSQTLLSGITAAAYYTDGSLRTITTTDGSGQYRLVLPPGTFRIVVYDNARHYTTQFWRATTDFEAAANVSVAAGQTAGSVDFTVGMAGVLAGKVRDARTGSPLAGIALQVFTPAGAKIANAATAADGSWGAAVPPGDAKVVASDPTLRYRSVFFAAASTFATATTLSPASGQTLGGVDFALPLASSSSPVDRWVVAAASSPGANGTYFRTDLWVLNPGATTANLSLTWLPSGGSDNSGAVPVARAVAPGAELAVSDAVATLFGAGGGGAIRVSSDVPVLVATRTATPAPGSGSYGLGIPGVDAARAVTSGRIPAIRVDGAFRTNVGFLNPGIQPLTVTLALSDGAGAPLATGTVTLGPLGQYQASTIASYLGLATVPQGTLRVTAPAPFFAYATVIDQATGDSTYVAAEPD